jgi:hypothetical protein
LTAHQDQAAASGQADGTTRVFRSPVAIAVWWIWVLFAVANLIDLAVQGHDRISLIAAISLVLVTGVLYAAVQRPRIVLDDEALTIVNPLRDHRIGWAGVSGAEAADMVRVRCEWPAGRKTIYAWAIYSSRRRQVVAEMRAQRLTRSRRFPAARGYGAGPGADAPGADAPGAAGPGRARTEPNDSDRVVAAITARAGQSRAGQGARGGQPGAPLQPGAGRPVSTWYWPASAAIIIPALALIIAILA